MDQVSQQLVWKAFRILRSKLSERGYIPVKYLWGAFRGEDLLVVVFPEKEATIPCKRPEPYVKWLEKTSISENCSKTTK